MSPKPFILAKTNWDFSVLYRTTKQALGYMVNRTTDQKSLDKDCNRYYYSLSEFLDEHYQYDTDMEGLILDHYHYTFGLIIDSDLYSQLLEQRCLKVIGTETVKRGYTYAIATGSLRDWRDSVIDGCAKSATEEYRSLLTDIYDIFNSEGLSKLWSGYNKIQYKDTTVLIEM